MMTKDQDLDRTEESTMEYEELKRRLGESLERRGLARRVADKNGRPQWRLTDDDGANEEDAS
jgi:hypothetical protein